MTEQPLPVVRARVFNRLVPCQSAELPVFRESTLEGLDTSVLVFAGLRRQPGVYSNLILQNVGSPGSAEAFVEVFAPDGTLLGSEDVPIPVEDAFHSLTLIDVGRAPHHLAGRRRLGPRDAKVRGRNPLGSARDHLRRRAPDGGDRAEP